MQAKTSTLPAPFAGSSEGLDAFELSRRCLLVVIFSKTNSPYFQTALSVAATADTFERVLLTPQHKDAAYIIGFGRTVEQAARAEALLNYIAEWKSVQYFAKGRVIPNHWKVRTVLSCYQTAASCSNTLAHCVVMKSDPFVRDPRSFGGGFAIRISLEPHPEPSTPPPKVLRLAFPCRAALDGFLIERNHPAEWREQIEAEVVRQQADWCPLFNVNNFSQYD
ncbi:hypothetical protein [Hydrogenophaga sp.]|uniref:hypothetical protein n=1 Tax=Hydrogenophaga sp. TaxID=1904254 RepID=UPI0027356BCC|nr:hypothetical protein [Hydrogenophaga sp.]MDP3887036.1 hypothetical protein [Hydrogenophaga sp.]